MKKGAKRAFYLAWWVKLSDCFPSNRFLRLFRSSALIPNTLTFVSAPMQLVQNSKISFHFLIMPLRPINVPLETVRSRTHSPRNNKPSWNNVGLTRDFYAFDPRRKVHSYFPFDLGFERGGGEDSFVLSWKLQRGHSELSTPNLVSDWVAYVPF